MKKKILATLLAITIVISVTACGSTDNSNADVSEENVVSEVMNVPETTNTEEVETETEEVDTRLEDGMAKIDNLFEAHEVLISQGKVIENTLQSDVESLDCQLAYLEYCTTADGKTLQTYESINNTAIIYYYSYVNDNGSYYDINTWILEQENSESISGLVENTGETNTTLFLEAIGVIAYMKNCESVVGVEVIDTTEYVISGRTSAYVIPLNCDGDTALTAVFDAEGNLLNVCTPMDGSWNNYLSSFPE